MRDLLFCRFFGIILFILNKKLYFERVATISESAVCERVQSACDTTGLAAPR